MFFAKIGFHRAMPLYFLGFVTNGAFSRVVPLSDFYKSSISVICAIRLFHRQGNIRSCDIKYLASRMDEGGDLRRKVWTEIKSLLLKRAVLRQKPHFYSDGAARA